MIYLVDLQTNDLWNFQSFFLLHIVDINILLRSIVEENFLFLFLVFLYHNILT